MRGSQLEKHFQKDLWGILNTESPGFLKSTLLCSLTHLGGHVFQTGSDSLRNNSSPWEKFKPQISTCSVGIKLCLESSVTHHRNANHEEIHIHADGWGRGCCQKKKRHFSEVTMCFHDLKWFSGSSGKINMRDGDDQWPFLSSFFSFDNWEVLP